MPILYYKSSIVRNQIMRCFSVNLIYQSQAIILYFLLLGVVSSPLFSQNTTDGIVVANGDVKRLYENAHSEIDVLNNDYGIQNGVGNLVITIQPKHGTAEVVNNVIRIIPNRNFKGDDSFCYSVCNTHNVCDTANVQLIVIDFDFKPQAITDSIEMIYGLSDGMRFDILQNDIDAFDEPFEITILTQPNNGSGSINKDYTLSPVFDYDFIGKDSLQYRMCDAEGDCDTAWVYCEILNGDINNLFIPNALSPNGDGVNDMFRLPQLMSDVQMRITIFTQWGQVVYQNENYLNNWDGKGNLGVFNGKDLEAGTYYYVLKIGDDRPPIKNYIYLSR